MTLVDLNCCRGSIIFSAATPVSGNDPRITAFHTRNKPSGMAVPRTIAVLKIKYIRKPELVKTGLSEFHYRHCRVWCHLTFGKSPSRSVQRTGTTFCKNQKNNQFRKYLHLGVGRLNEYLVNKREGNDGYTHGNSFKVGLEKSFPVQVSTRYCLTKWSSMVWFSLSLISRKVV